MERPEKLLTVGSNVNYSTHKGGMGPGFRWRSRGALHSFFGSRYPIQMNDIRPARGASGELLGEVASIPSRGTSVCKLSTMTDGGIHETRQISSRSCGRTFTNGIVGLGRWRAAEHGDCRFGRGHQIHREGPAAGRHSSDRRASAEHA